MNPLRSDGRNIDSSLGTLSGEASQQRVHALPAAQDFHEREMYRVDDSTYYDRPVIKKSVWSWTIPAYYYTGGVTGASAVIGAAATLMARDRMRYLITRTRWISNVGTAASAALLIHDLGRPSRFLNMLRVFRPTSPMSMGSWILTGFSSLAGLALIGELGPEALEPLGDLAAVGSGFLGMALSGYTGVLIAHTTVPVWQRPHRILPVLFMSSAAASASSLLDFFPGSPAEHRAVRVFGMAGKASELSAAVALERQVATVPAVVAPLRSGFSGFLWRAGIGFSAASLALSLLPAPSRKLRRLTGILGTAGVLCTRFGIHYAGQRSALDPRATFHQQRQGQGAYAVTGISAIAGPAVERAVSETVFYSKGPSSPARSDLV